MAGLFFCLASHTMQGFSFYPRPHKRRGAPHGYYMPALPVIQPYTYKAIQRTTDRTERTRPYIPIIIGRLTLPIIAPAPLWSLSTVLHLLHRYPDTTATPDAVQASAELPYYNKVYNGDQLPTIEPDTAQAVPDLARGQHVSRSA